MAAEWAVEAINARQQGLESPVHLHKAKPELVVRASTTRAPRAVRKIKA
jgi:hypothetical protein